MKYTGTTYRPPYEADSLLVQVTQGCSHNSCSFCTIYRDVPFAVEELAQVEHDLLEARAMYQELKALRRLREEERLLTALELEYTFLLGMHTSNAVPLAGYLSDDKERLLTALSRGIVALDEDFLAARPKRGFEGRYVS